MAKRGLVVILAVGLAVAGCSSMGQNTQRGAAGGALLGSIAGGVIGNQSGHGVGGALIGAGVGAIGGGLIGDSIDSKNKAAASTPMITTTGEKLGISDVIALSKSGLSDDAIISKIYSSGSVYNLSVEEIEMLRKEGVSTRVINTMMSTAKK